MTRVLLLGGTGEGHRLARGCANASIDLVYSVAGLTRVPDLPCEVRSGGFGGETGLFNYLRENHVQLLVDATHPYAANISRHAQRAAKRAGCPAWALRRSPWHSSPDDDWRMAADWSEVLRHIEPFGIVLFTIGREPLNRSMDRAVQQRWVVRALARDRHADGIQVFASRGPFSLQAELELFAEHRVEVLVSKNSGGSAVAAKLVAARRLDVPVVMLDRPRLPPLDREFHDVEALVSALQNMTRGGPA
jgi:precorrin-6A/cobalt-precorrin-6A reductase